MSAVIKLLMDLLKTNFYWIDFSIATAALIAVFLLYRAKVIGKYAWHLFWLGFALGLCWEAPLSLLNQYSVTHPAAKFLTPLPTHFSVLIIMHSFWDGGLFLIGVGLVYLANKARWFEKFQVRELLILIAWGQASELWVELMSTYNQGWAYIPYWWNPSLFKFNGSDITLLPQLIWLVAPVIYYFAALKLKSRPA